MADPRALKTTPATAAAPTIWRIFIPGPDVSDVVSAVSPVTRYVTIIVTYIIYEGGCYRA